MQDFNIDDMFKENNELSVKSYLQDIDGLINNKI